MENALAQPICAIDDEAILVRRMADGDEEALKSIYSLHSRRLFAYAFRVTGSQSAAEEVLQDSLLAAWKGARGFRGEARVSTWLLGIVHRQALNAVRRKQLPIAGLDEAIELADHRTGPSEHAESLDRRRVLATALQQLSPEHRTVVDLVFYHGLALAEVAQVCDCPLGTVKSRLNYAKGRLRVALTGAGFRAEDLL